MALDIKELRIGNYINGIIGDDSELVLCSVTGYDPRDEFLFVSNDNNIHYAEFVDFKPIPITEEWLLKFGFHKDGEYYSNGTKHYHLPSNCFYSGNDHVSGGNVDARIIYVHQFQNLFFSLCGKELTTS